MAGPRRIGVLYTGGTFGMERTGRGLAPSADLPQRLDAALADRAASDLPQLAWLDGTGPAIASSDARPAFWYDVADALRAAARDCDGFVVIHGTDTLAYTGAALSFLLARLERPVAVTGASAPLGEPGSDALEHFLTAVRAVEAMPVPQVVLAFGGVLLRANRATKRHGVGDNPFTAPCEGPLATADSGGARWHDDSPLPPVADALPVEPRREPRLRVGLVPVHPGLSGDMVRALARSAPAALVLEGYSAGIGPGGDADFVAAVRETVDAGTLVVALSQGHHGRIPLGKYATSTPLAEAGLISGADMTREAVLAKLQVLLGIDMSTAEVAGLLQRNLRGELTPDPE
jgi:L-asparaginase